MFASTEAKRQRVLEGFSAAIDGFDEAHEQLTPFSQRAYALDELGQAWDAWNESPDDTELRERYKAALEACDDDEDHRCRPETLREHAAQMAVLADRFTNLFEAFKRTAGEGADMLPIRELFETECRLYELAVDGFASYARRASMSAIEGHRDALREAIDRLIRQGSPEADIESVLASSDALLAGDVAYFKGFEESAELASLKADGYTDSLREARDWQSALKRTSPKTTQDVNRYVIRDAARSLAGVAVYAALCWWLAGIVPKVAKVLFWVGMVQVAFKGVQVFIILTTGIVLSVGKLFGVRPTAEEANTWPAAILRTGEFAVMVFAAYLVYHRL